MEALVFPSEEALQVALRTGLIPTDMQRGAAKAGFTSDGTVEVAPATAVTAKVKKSLQNAGVSVRDASVRLDEFSCWAELLAPRAVGEPSGSLPLVLFTVSGEKSLLEVAGELLRLGCDRMELQVVSAPRVHALLRVVEPPWFVLSRALDEFDGLRAFVPAVPGQERVWTQLGFAHPLHATLEAPDSGLVLVPRAGAWWRIDEGTWTDLDSLLVPAGLPPRTGHAATTPPRVEVKLSLARTTRAEVPTLFVLEDGRSQVEALVRSTPEAQLDNVLFAVSGSRVLLRPRPGREASALALPGTPYARVHDLPNLFAPLELTVEPPLRRDRLRTWLAPDPDALTWLQPAGNGFDRHTLSEGAFRPLADWVEYVIDGHSDTLTAWARSATFDFEAFATNDEARATTAEPEEVEEVVRPRTRTRRTAEPRRPRERAAEPATEAPAAPPRLELELPSSPSEAEEVVAHEEATFLELDAPADSPARRTAWARLGEMYARVTRTRDSGMAWAHAVWEASEAEALELSRRWAATSGARLDTVLAQTTPNSEQTRGVAAHLYVAALEKNPAAAARVTDYATFVERFADGLDVRSYWLSHVALARLSGGDPLRLARARDRVLSRLQGGLSLERDVPRLLRVTGQSAASTGTSRATRVVTQLDALLRAFEDTQRKRSTLEAPWELTRAYVSLEFAWGFARLAHADRARALREAALKTLQRPDPVHGFLSRAYSARIDQALEGVDLTTPLPPPVSAELSSLEAGARYRVDRLRQNSQVLEPQERIALYVDYLRRNKNPNADELTSLSSLREPAELLRGIRSRMESLPKLNVEERARVADALLDYLPQLPEAQALPLLNEFTALADKLPARQRTLVLEDSLRVAGHFGREALVKQLVLRLTGAIVELGPTELGELGGVLVSGMRSLRRVGLRTEAAELLARAITVLKGDDVPALLARLGLAAGFTYLGAFAQAQPIVDDALARLGREGMQPQERTRLSRATAQVFSHASTEVALPGLLRVAQQLPWITDSFSTNTHFCVSMVELADALVLGHVGDDLTLNETTRRFLDEDEFLVRRRVHRDVGSTS